MTAVRITIDDQATPLLGQLLRLPRHPTYAELGTDVSQQVRDHLYRMDGEKPNRLGGKRTHFYAQAADKTTFAADDKGTTISIGNPGAINKGNALRQRVNGGVIEAQNARMLTIPISPRAHGKRAREFPELELVVLGNRHSGKDAAFLAELDEDGYISDLLYVLKRSVNQKGDRSLLPGEQEIQERVALTFNEILARIL